MDQNQGSVFSRWDPGPIFLKGWVRIRVNPTGSATLANNDIDMEGRTEGFRRGGFEILISQQWYHPPAVTVAPPLSLKKRSEKRILKSGKL